MLYLAGTLRPVSNFVKLLLRKPAEIFNPDDVHMLIYIIAWTKIILILMLFPQPYFAAVTKKIAYTIHQLAIDFC